MDLMGKGNDPCLFINVFWCSILFSGMGGLNENGSQIGSYLSTWPPVGRTIPGGLGGVALLGRCVMGEGFKVSKD